MSESTELVDLPVGVVYRTGRPTRTDYWLAVRDLIHAAKQLNPDGEPCAVCGSTGHQAWECNHNPLVMARRQAAERHTWRCFHCGEVFTDGDAARQHFGPSSKVDAACLTSAPNNKLSHGGEQ